VTTPAAPDPPSRETRVARSRAQEERDAHRRLERERRDRKALPGR